MKIFFNLVVFSMVFVATEGVAKTYEVLILKKSNGQSMVYDPMFLKVEVGDAIKFVPKDMGHTSQSVFTPDGVEPWKGKTSKEISITLEKEGVYIYECQNHGIMGMAGIIQVGNAVNLNEAKEFFSKFKNKFIMHKDRLNPIIDKIQ